MRLVEDSKAVEWRTAAAFGASFILLVSFSWVATRLKSPQPAQSDTDPSQNAQDGRVHFPDHSQALEQIKKRARQGEPIDLDEFMRLNSEENARKRDAEENPDTDVLKGRVATNQTKLKDLDQRIQEAVDLAKQSTYDADNTVRQNNMTQQQNQLQSASQYRWPDQPTDNEQRQGSNQLMQRSEDAMQIDTQRRSEVKELYRQRKILDGQIGEDSLRLRSRGVPGY